MARWSWVLVFVLAATSAVASPLQMPLQGVLRDNAGMSVSEGSFSVTFALYETETGGAPVWTEAWPPSGSCAGAAPGCLTVSNGAFHVMLGTHVPLSPSLFGEHPDLWLGMKVETDPELPRRRVGATGNAFHAALADQAAVATSLACSACVGALQLDPAGLATVVPAWDHDVSDDLTMETAFAGEVSGPWNDLRIDCTGCIGAGALDPALLGQLAGGALLEDVSNGTLTNTFDTSGSNTTVAPFTEGLVGVTSTVTLPDVGTIMSLSVDLSVAYVDVKDLTATLTSPAGLVVKLVARNLVGPDIAGTFPTTLTPFEPLTPFEGQPMAGVWTLKIVDDVPSFSPPGELLSWALHVHSLSGAAVASNASLDMRAHGLTGLPEPSAPSDAATKGYVDAMVSREVFGDGSDGDVTITGTVSLNRNMYYKNLTINAGATLRPAGWMIFVSGTLTNNGTIERNGSNGGAGGNCQGYCYTGGAPGGGGSGDAGGFLPPIVAGGGGGGGGNGQCNGCPSASPGGGGGSGQAAVACLIGASGSKGGNGGGGTSTSGGSGGSGGTSSLTKNPKLTLPTLHTLLHMVDYASLAKFTTSGSPGGGGGGGGANGCQRGGGGGGGSGSNGGLIVVVAKTIAAVGSITAVGGNGGAGGGGCECGGVCGVAGGGGGGAGGNGGAVVLAWLSRAAGGNVALAGGSPGAGGPGAPAGSAPNGSAGTAGTAGVLVDVDLSPLLQ